MTSSVRAYDGTVTDERCRSVMGSLGLVGDKAIRRIGTLSGGEKARVALATFCLTPHNVCLHVHTYIHGRRGWRWPRFA